MGRAVTDYIPRNLALEALYANDPITMKGVGIINGIRAANVKPIVNGFWKKSETVLGHCTCSNCGFSVYLGYAPFFDYCPHCGAQMKIEV